jgi:MoxR-like ATPase
MFNLWLDYPSSDEEIKIVQTTTSEYQPALSRLVTAEELIRYQDLIRRVPAADNVIQYAVKVVGLTRPSNGASPKFIKDWVNWGAGPRASQYLILAAKTRAVIQGRYTPNIDDVKASMMPVLRHRIITNFSAEADGIRSVDVIEKILTEAG